MRQRGEEPPERPGPLRRAGEDLASAIRSAEHARGAARHEAWVEVSRIAGRVLLLLTEDETTGALFTTGIHVVEGRPARWYEKPAVLPDD
jgi:hypothetical protein